MPTEIEGTHEVVGKALYTKTWKPDETPVAKLIFVHGFNDHIGRYYELFPTLASRGIEVHGFDQRGWGRSALTKAEQGNTGPTALVIADIVSVIKSQLPSSVPVFLMGHSMGGGEVLTLACDPMYADVCTEIRGWLLESPFVGFPEGLAPNSFTVFAGKLAGRVMPKMKKFAPLPPETLTRDPEVVKSLKEDKLLHGNGTLEGLSGMLERTDLLTHEKTKLCKHVRSIWFSHGTADHGTSYPISKKWFEDQCKDVDDKEFKTYEGWSHQLHADLPDDRAVFAANVGDWILARTGGQSKL